LGDDTRLHVIDIETGQTIRFSADLPTADTVLWSPDGSRLLVEASRSLWIVEADGSTPRQLDGPGDFSAGTWTPDGEAVIGFSHQGMYRLALAGGTPERISAARAREVAWSPDGERMALLTFDEGRTVTVLTHGSGQEQRLIEPAMRDLNALQWSPDGERVMAMVYNPTTTDRRLHLLDPQAGTGSTLSERGMFPAWSDDGRYLAYTEIPDQAAGEDILLLSDQLILVDTHTPETVTLPVSPEAYQWLPGTHDLLYIERSFDMTTLGGASRRLFRARWTDNGVETAPLLDDHYSIISFTYWSQPND
jgi:Tol biopolymer transport system component